MTHTLYNYWTAVHNQHFADGVRLLKQYMTKNLVTPRILQQLQVIATNGETPSEYYLGKLTHALRALPAPPRESIDIAWADSTSVFYRIPPRMTQYTWDFTVMGYDDTESQNNMGKRFGPPILEAILSPNITSTPDTRILHKEHSHYHALMVAATDDEKRAEYARKIMEEINPQLDSMYDALREGGEVETQEKPPAKTQATADDMKKLVSVRTRISRLLILIEQAPTLIRKAELQKQLEEKQAEKARLEALIA